MAIRSERPRSSTTASRPWGRGAPLQRRARAVGGSHRRGRRAPRAALGFPAPWRGHGGAPAAADLSVADAEALERTPVLRRGRWRSSTRTASTRGTRRARSGARLLDPRGGASSRARVRRPRRDPRRRRRRGVRDRRRAGAGRARRALRGRAGRRCRRSYRVASDRGVDVVRRSEPRRRALPGAAAADRAGRSCSDAASRATAPCRSRSRCRSRP